MSLALSLALAPQAQASEIDDISTFYMEVADAEGALNQKIQQAFDKSAAEVSGCDFDAFGKGVAAEIVSLTYYSGSFERYASNAPEIQRTKPALKDSVYKNSAFAKSVIGRFYGLDGSLNVGGQRIGTDKLGHFVDHGYKLFKMWIGGSSLIELLNNSIAEEEGAWGWLTTGVKSMADMAANSDGFAFWKNVYGRGSNNYFHCESGSLRQKRPFRFAEYVTQAWSEAINCSLFGDEELATMIQKNVLELEERDGKRYQCPLRPGDCPKIRSEYQKRLGPENVDRVISPLCR